MNHYVALRTACGLSVSASARFLGVQEDTSRQWSSGRRQPPDELLHRLCDLVTFLHDEASRIGEVDEDGVVVFEVPVDDDAAIDLGFPCVGSWLVSAGRAIVLTDRPTMFRQKEQTLCPARAMP